MIKIHFCKSNDFFGWLIRLGTFSKYNHVAIEINGWVYEALSLDGVVKKSAEHYNWNNRWVKHEVFQLNEGLDERLIALFLEGQLGKKYDWGGVFALPFRQGWQNDDKWFCSELVAEALREGGMSYALTPSRVTPRDLYARIKL